MRNIKPQKMYRSKSCKVVTLLDKTIHGAQSYVSSCNLTPDTVVLQVADNSLANSKDANTCFSQISKLVSHCKTKFTDPNICVVQVLPRRLRTKEMSECYNSKVGALNEILKDSPVVLIPMDWADSRNIRDYTANDGVHLNPSQLVRSFHNRKTRRPVK